MSSVISVASGGDTNGDGFDDVLLGAKDFSVSGQNGMVELFLGSGTGPSTMADWTETGADNAIAQFGRSVASAGDINGDGYGDVLIGSPDGLSCSVFLFLGSASGPEATNAWYATGVDLTGFGANLGFSVAGAGDINGDGFPDVIVGDNLRNSSASDQGSAFIFSEFNIPRDNPTPTPTPTPTPVVVFPGKGELPAPAVTTSGSSATITAPLVTPQLTARAKAAAIKKLMKAGLTKAQATKAVSKLTVTYIFTVTQGSGASAAGADEVGVMRSSISRRDKRNRITFNNLPPGAKTASYRIEISTRKPPVVLGTTKPSAKTPFTITR